jgi:hypothetical protein
VETEVNNTTSAPANAAVFVANRKKMRAGIRLDGIRTDIPANLICAGNFPMFVVYLKSMSN